MSMNPNRFEISSLSEWDKIKMAGNAYTVHNVGEILAEAVTMVKWTSAHVVEDSSVAETEDDDSNIDNDVSGSQPASPSFRGSDEESEDRSRHKKPRTS